MKLKIYDDIYLNTEFENLSQKGIHKGCSGIILDIKADECFVRFRNHLNRGDYACININSKFLDFDEHQPKEHYPAWEHFKATGDLEKDSFKPQKFFEYDCVELAVEKDKYAKFGVHKGAKGAIMEDFCIDSEYYVIFTDYNTGYDIADIAVHEDDLILVKK